MAKEMQQQNKDYVMKTSSLSTILQWNTVHGLKTLDDEQRTDYCVIL